MPILPPTTQPTTDLGRALYRTTRLPVCEHDAPRSVRADIDLGLAIAVHAGTPANPSGPGFRCTLQMTTPVRGDGISHTLYEEVPCVEGHTVEAAVKLVLDEIAAIRARIKADADEHAQHDNPAAAALRFVSGPPEMQALAVASISRRRYGVGEYVPHRIKHTPSPLDPDLYLVEYGSYTGSTCTVARRLGAGGVPFYVATVRTDIQPDKRFFERQKRTTSAKDADARVALRKALNGALSKLPTTAWCYQTLERAAANLTADLAAIPPTEPTT